MSSQSREPVPDLMPTARELIASIIARLPGLSTDSATRNAEAAIRQDQRRRQEWIEAQLPAPAALPAPEAEGDPSIEMMRGPLST